MKYKKGDIVKIKVKSPKYGMLTVGSERIGIILHTTDIGLYPGYTLLIAGMPNQNCFLSEEDVQQKLWHINTILGKVGIIIGTTPQPGTYVILVCGDPEAMTYWEDEIEGVIEWNIK